MNLTGKGWASPALWAALVTLAGAIYVVVDTPTRGAVDALVLAVAGVVGALYQVGHHSAKKSADRAAVAVAEQRTKAAAAAASATTAQAQAAAFRAQADLAAAAAAANPSTPAPAVVSPTP